MDRRKALATTGAISLTATAAVVAIGSSMGLFGLTDDGDTRIGKLSPVDSTTATSPATSPSTSITTPSTSAATPSTTTGTTPDTRVDDFATPGTTTVTLPDDDRVDGGGGDHDNSGPGSANSGRDEDDGDDHDNSGPGSDGSGHDDD